MSKRPVLQKRACKQGKINARELRKSITMKSGGNGKASEGKWERLGPWWTKMAVGGPKRDSLYS